MALAESVSFKNVGEADVAPVLQSHKADLSNEALMELQREPSGRPRVKTAPSRQCLTASHLAAAFTHLEAGLWVLTSSRVDKEWKGSLSNQVLQGIIRWEYGSPSDHLPVTLSV